MLDPHPLLYGVRKLLRYRCTLIGHLNLEKYAHPQWVEVEP